MEHNNEQTISETLAGITHGVKRLGILYFEKARLKTTEKITILLATVAFSAVMMALGVVFFIFVSIGIGHYLATTMAPHLAYIIVAAFYLLIIALAMALRRRLFVDPISRFMSRLLVEEPEEVRAERLMNPNGGNNGAHTSPDTDSRPSPEPTPDCPTDGNRDKVVNDIEKDIDNEFADREAIEIVEDTTGKTNEKGGEL